MKLPGIFSVYKLQKLKDNKLNNGSPTQSSCLFSDWHLRQASATKQERKMHIDKLFQSI